METAHSSMQRQQRASEAVAVVLHAMDAGFVEDLRQRDAVSLNCCSRDALGKDHGVNPVGTDE
eukprot:12853180-Prorocentrum_lima.AAC.1